MEFKISVVRVRVVRYRSYTSRAELNNSNCVHFEICTAKIIFYLVFGVRTYLILVLLIHCACTYTKNHKVNGIPSKTTMFCIKLCCTLMNSVSIFSCSLFFTRSNSREIYRSLFYVDCLSWIFKSQFSYQCRYLIAVLFG